ncbi:hypothetical protein K493DRAFT_332448 [Basidiobolus meristosporus CBS 931.73]|uniref:Uncharacterized protein n=1 Tax=Basidiobolus meristosporus CBS 931.73 TaxID=1314790 RepID=A0A1Y1ZD54_9FUNG|nr:hypothetical protein K493DRAFT_332448 [Basidiobolus meristosporus CBS 931.73]|eukprot:ORY08104.1 hypothetical protein K493DRAFT_332448 [Basidiobolus meristosporus CBS 931.73]
MIESQCLLCNKEFEDDLASRVGLELDHASYCRCTLCSECIENNNGLSKYCNVCGKEREQSPKQDLIPSPEKALPDPPPYEDIPPQYTGFENFGEATEKSKLVDNGIHYVSDLKKANRLYDNNVIARRYLVIPGYCGPTESKPTLEDELKASVKRFQLVSKCVDPNEAKYYMASNDYSIEDALHAYEVDLKWEREHAHEKAKALPIHQAFSRSSTRHKSSSSQSEQTKSEKSGVWVKILSDLL